MPTPNPVSNRNSERREALAALEAQAHQDLEQLRARLTARRLANGLPPAPSDVAAGR